jgi:hypothetical protein
MNSNRLMHVMFSFDHELKQYRYFFRRPLPKGVMFQPGKYFAERETSAFLNRYMPVDYIQFTADMVDLGIEEAEKVICDGLSSRTVIGFPEELGEWEFFTGTARDHIKGVFVPKGLNLVLEEIGLHMDLTPDAKKTMAEKATSGMKYLNRLFAPVEHAVMGEVVETNGDVVTVLTECGKRLDIRHLDANPFVEGCSVFSMRGAQVMAGLEDPRIGDGFRFTSMDGYSLDKGHGLVVDMKYDAVFYGGKKMMKFDHFYFGRLSGLHVSDPNTDFQSTVNFFTTGKGIELLGNMYQKFFGHMVEAAQDSGRFRKMMLQVVERNPETDWTRALAAQLGMDACFPGLARADFKMLEPLLQDAQSGVVPMVGYAQRRYLMPTPQIFDDAGNVDVSRDRLRGNVVYSSGINPGPIVLYRQPNGNVDEHWNTTAVATPHRNMGRGEIVYLGSDIIIEALQAMGGGDFDDPVIAITDLEMVAHFQSLQSYPKVAKVEKAERKVSSRDLKYADRIQHRLDPNTWNKRHLMKQIDDLKGAVGIGVIVNAIMLDTLITVGKPAMLEDLSDRMASLASQDGKDDEWQAVIAAYKWLEKRPDYVLRDIGSDLESRIDGIKMYGGGGMLADEELIEGMYEDTQVYPWCWTIGGSLGKGRIPNRISKLDPLTAHTQLCRLLKDVKQEVGIVREHFIELEWLLVQRLPQELLSKYKATPELKEFVSEMRTWWYEEWQSAREKGATLTSEGVRAVYQRLCEELDFNISDSDFSGKLEDVAVHLASRIYRTEHPTAPVNEEGFTYHVGDGLLWTPSLGLAFLSALREAGLTGHVETVSLNPGCGRFKSIDVQVKVTGGIVQKLDDGKVLGTASKVDDGEYKMESGLIVVKPCHPSLRNNWSVE